MACCPTEEKYGYEDSRFEKAVDAHFHCSICYNVLKEPMMCRNNEHIFCRGCITEHLTVNSHTCPECNEDLTVETLRKARLVGNILSELKIKCDYSNRGCHEFIRLEELDSHVENCGFAPLKCSNEECQLVVDKRELIHHESTVCEYRKVKCHSCKKLEQDMEGIKEKIEGMEAMKEKMEGLASKEDVDDVKELMVQMFEKLGFLENTIQISSAINHASNALMEDVLIAGGWDNDGNRLKSVERFSWKKNVWERVSSMNVGRVAATSFVYENQLFVAGGCDSDAIEVLNLNECRLQWGESVANVPYGCRALLSVVYQNRAVLFCACGKTDCCAELYLTVAYTCKQLCKIPEPARKGYTVVAFEHKVLIWGGQSATNNSLLDSVLEFDINTNEFKAMPALPCAVHSMAAVRWGDQAILFGGFDQDGQSRKVYMYNSKTGTTTQLPSMLEERSGCAAVITGNTIVVMGGRGKTTGRVRSVEAFTLGGYSWRYLPAMNDIRGLATATVLPTKNIR
jgi:hypothetical protein